MFCASQNAASVLSVYPAYAAAAVVPHAPQEPLEILLHLPLVCEVVRLAASPGLASLGRGAWRGGPPWLRAGCRGRTGHSEALESH